MERYDRRMVLVSVLVVGSILVSAALNGLDRRGYQEYSISKLLEDRPFGEKVEVSGKVLNVLDDYNSSSGEVYQRFTVGKPSSSVLVYCSALNGRANVSEGDRVSVHGNFKSYQGTLEIETGCFKVERKN
ncbi:MAG: hypothetical protein MUP58_01930 [Candidatus Nanohaloarchaeota archaeon QJJ-9]|nr:hypothetical protein [Candidatus Nanohaloarchaeota archaeon QJJ-9]